MSSFALRFSADYADYATSLAVAVGVFCAIYSVYPVRFAAGVLHSAPAAAQVLPDISAWKIITSKEVGVSVLMPPGTVAADAGLFYEAKNGARLVGVIFDGPEGDGEQTYGAVVVRANYAALHGLRDRFRAEGVPAKKTPIDLLYEAEFIPLIDDARSTVSDDPKRVSVIRRPLLWHGMKGEEIKIERLAALEETKSFMHLRVIKNENSIYLLTAGEKNPTPASFVRVRRFFDSFTIAPGDPFGRKASKPALNKAKKATP